jgi:hypothetical protein
MSWLCPCADDLPCRLLSWSIFFACRPTAAASLPFTFAGVPSAAATTMIQRWIVDRRYPIALTDSATLQDLLQDGNLDALLSLSLSLFLSLSNSLSSSLHACAII